jgi:hypothetical protein
MVATFDSSAGDTKPAGKKNPPALPTALESSVDIPPLDSAAAAVGGGVMKSTPVTAKDRNEARKMRWKKRQDGTSQQDQQEINQVSTSRKSRLPPSQQEEEDSSSLASSTSSTRPGAVHVGDAKSNHHELPLQTQEEPDVEHGFETILPIAAVLPDDNRTIAEAQIVVTAKVCGQPRWLIFALMGVLVTGAIGVGLGVALSNGVPVVDTLPPTLAPSNSPSSDRRNEVEKIIRTEIPSLQLGPSQIEALNWLAFDDPANLDFELLRPVVLLERFVMALLYFSTAGETWKTSSGYLTASPLCSWRGVDCDFTVDESYPLVVEIDMQENNLHGQLPTELGLFSNLQILNLGISLLSGLIPSELGRLTSLEYLNLGESTTMSSSELDTIISLASVLQVISSTVL